MSSKVPEKEIRRVAAYASVVAYERNQPARKGMDMDSDDSAEDLPLSDMLKKAGANSRGKRDREQCDTEKRGEKSLSASEKLKRSKNAGSSGRRPTSTPAADAPRNPPAASSKARTKRRVVASGQELHPEKQAPKRGRTETGTDVPHLLAGVTSLTFATTNTKTIARPLDKSSATSRGHRRATKSSAEDFCQTWGRAGGARK